jgi:hypothetical protein
MLARMRNSIPGAYDKAYRWVAEMEEISDFLQQNPRRETCTQRLLGFTTTSRPRSGQRAHRQCQLLQVRMLIFGVATGGETKHASTGMTSTV